MNFITENLPLLLECAGHLAYCLALASAIVAFLLWRDMRKTVKEEIKVIMNAVYSLANDPEIDTETTRKITLIYRMISDLNRDI